jgi:hypothetical protein
VEDLRLAVEAVRKATGSTDGCQRLVYGCRTDLVAADALTDLATYYLDCLYTA